MGHCLKKLKIIILSFPEYLRKKGTLKEKNTKSFDYTIIGYIIYNFS